ncbi:MULTISPECIES: hypothetical protein [Kitasatospora]|uniref:ABC-2 type transport system permease protein n=1 Tax=Kitasatospora setae (strain ATCC 33774 / DSM 43861 / JCM 3304 / KCC A-0304 / NBRC 14216 / KM-6054) TaxID=452652 RepID=E4N4Q0_KITSK|nr:MULTISPECIES: hypothetical protein [Kitasatospora]BAJ26181.1 hypothetical protein KSE_03340 [Kitasatospora setae KM-6054]
MSGARTAAGTGTGQPDEEHDAHGPDGPNQADGADEADDPGTPAEWTADDDWTDEALALLRTLRAPHRRNRAKQIAFAAYCTVLLLLVWGGVPSFGLFLQASMGADYTRYGPGLLAAMPGGIAAVGLAVLLLAVRDGLWRGPVVPPRATTDWLLAHPVRPRPVLRPWFWLSCGLAAFPGLIAALGGMVALGLTVRTGLPAALGWSLTGALGLPLLGVCAGLLVQRDPRAAHWARLLTPYATVLVLLFATQSALAAAGHPVPWLERIELWSGPWGWAGVAALAPTPAAVPGGTLAAVLLVLSTALALLFADRAAGTVPLTLLRERARTAAGVMAALRTVEPRAAKLAVAEATGGTRRLRVRLPAPRRRALVMYWRDTLSLLRTPARPGRAVLLTVPAVLCAAPAHDTRGVLSWAVAALALLFGYLAVAQLLEPARIETDDVRRSSWSPYPFSGLMLRHAVVPALLALVLATAAAATLLLLGAGPVAWLAPLAVPPLAAAALVNACRGPARRDLLYRSPNPSGGSTGVAFFLAWYAAGPGVALPLLALPFSAALRDATADNLTSTATFGTTLTVLLLAWARHRATLLPARARPTGA